MKTQGNNLKRYGLQHVEWKYGVPRRSPSTLHLINLTEETRKEANKETGGRQCSRNRADLGGMRHLLGRTRVGDAGIQVTEDIYVRGFLGCSGYPIAPAVLVSIMLSLWKNGVGGVSAVWMGQSRPIPISAEWLLLIHISAVIPEAEPASNTRNEGKDGNECGTVADRMWVTAGEARDGKREDEGTQTADECKHRYREGAQHNGHLVWLARSLELGSGGLISFPEGHRETTEGRRGENDK